MVDTLVAATAVLLWAVTLLRFALWLRMRVLGRALLTLVFGGLAMSATFFTPAVYTWTETALAVPNIAEPLARTGVLVAAWGAQGMAHEQVSGNRSRVSPPVRLAALLCALGLVWLLFVAADLRAPTLHFTRDYGHRPLVAAYLLASLAYLSWALVDVLLGARAWGPRASPALRAGLHLIGCGCLAGCGYVAVKVAALVGIVVNTPLSERVEASVGRGLAVVAGLLVAAGCAAPSLAARTARLSTWWAERGALLALRPLWEDLVAATGVAFREMYRVRSRHRERLLVSGVHELLYRRVIEIRDAELVLRPYLDTDVAVNARCRLSSASDVEAAVQAAILTHAVGAAERAEPAEVAATPMSSAGPQDTSDLHWLLRVAAYYPDQPARPPHDKERMAA